MNNLWSTHLDHAVEAAFRAGNFQRLHFATQVRVEMKGDKDLVTEVDRESERLIVEYLHTHYPNSNVLAEEGEYSRSGSSLRWVIDPVDGTTNYAHGFPWFCTSIALEADGELVAGVIYNPIYNEMFTATKGGGTFLNGRRLHVSTHAPLRDSLLGTGFPYDCASNPANNFDSFIAFQKAARGIRRAGAAALDLASVAAGRLDGFWELKLKPWDVAAGLLMVLEAGGTVTGFDGSAYNMMDHRILASNGLIHNEMITVLSTTGTEGAP